MPTAVLDLDLQQLPPIITVSERYDRAPILIRLRRQPVGQALLPLRLANAKAVISEVTNYETGRLPRALSHETS